MAAMAKPVRLRQCVKEARRPNNPVEPASRGRDFVVACHDAIANRRELFNDFIDDGRIGMVDQEGSYARMLEDVGVVGCSESKIERDQDGADLTRGVEALEKEVAVGGEDADSVSFLDPERLERVGEAMNSLG